MNPRPWLWSWVAVAALVAVDCAGGSSIDPRAIGSDPGRLAERTYQVPLDTQYPTGFTDITQAWGLDGYANTSPFQPSGGVALGDIDGDGFLDMVVAGGDLELFFGDGSSMTPAIAAIVPAVGEVSSVSIADLDGDGEVDLLVGVIGGDDMVIWGGPWRLERDPSQATRSALPGGAQTVGLLPADLGGDRRLDVLQLSHAATDADIIWVQQSARSFTPNVLPTSYRQSFAAEVVDLDSDGLLDIWITRDIGWQSGPDSIYTRSGDRGGPWVDVASNLGTNLAVDGMGVAVADLDGDGDLDGYISDIGENDIFFAEGGRYSPASHTGAGRIRPPHSAANMVSSSWAVAAADFNLDGLADLVVANGGFGGSDIVNKVSGTEIVDLDTPAFFIGLGEGRFGDAWPGMGIPWTDRLRGLALGDLDADGDTDIVFASYSGGVRLLRNDSTAPSVTITVEGPCAPGSLVSVVGSGFSYRSLVLQHPFLGSSEARLAVGTRGDTVEVTVNRPDLGPWTREVTATARAVVAVPCD